MSQQNIAFTTVSSRHGKAIPTPFEDSRRIAITLKNTFLNHLFLIKNDRLTRIGTADIYVE